MKVLLQDFAYQKCRELIQDGKLISGKLYSEVALSKEMDISRTPLRSAIQRLEKEGVLTRLPQRGFQINSFSLSDIKELFAVRKAIEGYAVEFLAMNSDDLDLDTIIKNFSSYQMGDVENESEDDYLSFLEADRQFHQTLIQALNNSRLEEMYGDLRQSITLIAIKRFKLAPQRDQSLKEHKAIIEAIEKKDSIAARKAMYRHLDSAMELVEKNTI